MNTANLQLEGLLLALGSVLRALRREGLVSGAALERALDEALQKADGDARRQLVTPANQNAIRFPIDFLKRAALSSADEDFSAIASGIGRDRDATVGPAQEGSLHPAGPHARDDLTEREATPSTGALPERNASGDVDPGTG